MRIGRRRWITVAAGAGALAALLVASALWLLVDRDALRQLVAATVKSQTGWDLSVERPVELSLEGGVDLTLRALRVEGSAAGTMRADTLRLRLDPLALLGRRLEPRAVRLEGLEMEWQGPRRIDLSADLRHDPVTQTLVAEPLEVILDGAPARGNARWQGGETPAVTATLRAPAIVLAGARLTDLVVDAELRGGVLRQSAVATLYGGKGDAVLERAGAGDAVSWSLRAILDGVRIHDLARDLGREAPVEGTATGELALRWRGHDASQFRRTLDGAAQLALRDGALTGIDLPALFRLAGDALDSGGPASPERGRMPLTALDATAAIENGVLRNDDLRGDAPPFQLGGRGTVDLGADRIDYTLVVTLPETAPDVGKRLKALRGVPIPVRLTGPIADPAIGLDLDAVLQAVARQRLERKLDGKLGDKLRSLLGR